MIPAGYALVPIEPSYDMLRAAKQVLVDVDGEDEGGHFYCGGNLVEDGARDIWKAMIRAARIEAGS